MENYSELRLMNKNLVQSKCEINNKTRFNCNTIRDSWFIFWLPKGLNILYEFYVLCIKEYYDPNCM